MRLYDHNGELVQGLRAANRWNEQRLRMKCYRDELSKNVQLALLDADRLLDAYELAPLVGAPVDDVTAIMIWLEARGWIQLVS